MPRPTRAPRVRRPGDELTKHKIEFLIHGHCWFTHADEVFADTAAARACWREYRDEILACRDDRKAPRAYQPGTRPWGFWRFDQKLDDAPDYECAALLELGLIGDDERKLVVRLSRAQWEWQTTGWVPEWQAAAALVTDDVLLQYWPGIPPDIDRNGQVVHIEPEDEEEVETHE